MAIYIYRPPIKAQMNIIIIPARRHIACPINACASEFNRGRKNRNMCFFRKQYATCCGPLRLILFTYSPLIADTCAELIGLFGAFSGDLIIYFLDQIVNCPFSLADGEIMQKG